MASLRNGTLGLRKGVGEGKMLILELRLLDPDHRLSISKVLRADLRCSLVSRGAEPSESTG